MSGRLTVAARLVGIIPALILLGAARPAGQQALGTAVWDFEAEDTHWQPRAETIAVTRVEGLGATEGSKACLRIRGRIEGGYNYALSDQHPMEAGKLYRLSAWLRVDSLGETTPMPYLKCEFVPADPKRDGGRVNTSAYDAGRMAQWQQLVAEFQAPDGTGHCWLALEKGTSQPTEIDAYLDDVKVERIERLSVLEKYRLEPIPVQLEAVRGVHPRIYLTAQRIGELRQAIKTTHAPLWEEVRAQADSVVQPGAPAYREQPDSSGDEQLWQRGVGNTMPALAMAYVLTGERKYLDSAREWALASCGYRTWGLGRTDGMDLAAGHQLFGLGIVYDWCFEGLGDEARRTIRETLVKRTSAMFEAAAAGNAWWHRAYLQNHLWVNIAGMAVAGLAVFDEVEGATQWIALPLDKFQRTMAVLGPDGASHEGVGYWGYGVEYMLKFMHLARDLLGVDMFDNEWWRSTATYRQYLALPRNAWSRRSNIVDIADCPRGNWYGPDYLLRRLAREYRDGYAQWLAQQIDDADVDSPEARWLNLVWFDPTLPARPPDDRPTLRHFPDMDIVSARSDWSGDESLLVLKCGPYIGHEAVQQFTYDPGGGHVHPDANHFVLFGCGDWLIRDDGYRAKWTGQHNTLLIDGKGQLGEGARWFQGAAALRLKARPHIVRATSSPELDHIVGDATQAYPRDSGLRRYVRHALLLKPDVLIVADDIALDAEHELELRLHPEHSQAERDGASLIIRSERAALRLEPLTTDGVAVAAEDVPGEDRRGSGWSMFTVRLTTKRSEWRNAVALSWAPASAAPVRVTMQREGEQWRFSAGERTVALNWARGEATAAHGAIGH